VSRAAFCLFLLLGGGPGQADSLPGEPGPRRAVVDFEARGLYVNGRLAGSPRLLELVERLEQAGGNTIVFDVKDCPGDLSYVSRVPLARQIGAIDQAPLEEPAKLIDFLHQRHLHVVARLACFCDSRLARERPDLVPLARGQRQLWSEQGAPDWVDPSLPEVQDYLLALAEEVAQMGVDEIQLDYVRFPTEGPAEQAVFAFDEQRVPKHQVITGFVCRMRQALRAKGVLLSADIFGVAAWEREADVHKTGQRLGDLLNCLEVVSPMLYPSHFEDGFDRVDRPVDYPHYFVSQGCARVQELARAHGVVVRPWIQAFDYRVEGFDDAYVTEQLHGARDGGARGWLLWNSAGRYEVGLAAMENFLGGAAAPSRQPRLPQRLAAPAFEEAGASP
jgi:hypothetical protein